MSKPEPGVDVLLDTHVLLWWQAASDRLSRNARRRIEHAPHVLVSPISFWELAMLVEKGRVGLDRSTAAWVQDFVATDRVEIADVTPAIAVAAAELSGFHGDPADRLLVATARSHGVPLVSKDDKVRKYAQSSGGLSVVW